MVFRADQEIGRDLAAVDWTSTRLGPVDGWPQSLCTAVNVLLSSQFAMWMAWGPDLTFFCNAAYRRDTLGLKYPWALGRPASEVWAEIWVDVSPRIERVLSTGEATWGHRYRRLEDTARDHRQQSRSRHLPHAASDAGLEHSIERSGYYSSYVRKDHVMATPLSLNTDRGVDGTPRVTAAGEIDISNIDVFSQALTTVSDGARGPITVDLSAVKYLDSAGINALSGMPTKSTVCTSSSTPSCFGFLRAAVSARSRRSNRRLKTVTVSTVSPRLTTAFVRARCHVKDVHRLSSGHRRADWVCEP